MNIERTLRCFIVLSFLMIANPWLLGQQPLSVAQFEGDQEWPLYKPGDLELKPIAPERLRSLYVFRNRNPRDPQAQPVETELVMDVLPVQFPAGNPAYLIQWSSLGSDSGASALDLLYVDRRTFQVYFRVAASGPGSFAGNYDVHLYQPEKTHRIRIGDQGQVTPKENSNGEPRFDFASFTFLFALMDLEEGQKFRLLNIGPFADLDPRQVSVRVGGRLSIEDAHGKSHEVTEVVMTNPTRASFITFWVDDEAPYDYGWRFQLVASGATISEKRFRRLIREQ